MPHDKNGREVKIGDKVTLEFEVVSVSESEFCSCTLKSLEVNQGESKSSLTVNCKDLTTFSKEQLDTDPF